MYSTDDPPPPEVLHALAPLPAGGPWEGGTVDRDGRRWYHAPWRGWEPDRPTAAGGRVYESETVRRAARQARRETRRVTRRRERWARGLAATVLLVAGAMVSAGVADRNPWWALPGVTLAALVLGWTLPR